MGQEGGQDKSLINLLRPLSLYKLQVEFEAARERAQEQEARYAVAVRLIADIAGISEERAAAALAAIEAQPMMPRESLMRRIAEAWLDGQRHA